MSQDALDRYASILPDPAAFARAAARPEPTHLRVTTARAEPRDVVQSLTAQGFELEPVPGLDGVFTVTREPFPVSNTLEHWAGLCYLQQAVTCTAAPALGAVPGERILDMAAAPGGKTTHLADLLRERGTLVANDRSDNRIRGLLGNLYRTAHPVVTVTAADGRDLGGEAAFDRVLLDAPCSGEGNLRSRGGELPAQSARWRERVGQIQEGLLRRAVELARPGGVVLYATCTFDPAENEAVVDRVLADTPVSLEPIPLDVPHAPGLTRWGGSTFHPDLEAAWRLYPHHLDSGGLFLARLRKEGPAERSADAAWTPVPPAFDGSEEGEAARRIERVEDELRDAYGVPAERLERLRWMLRGDSLWATTADAWNPAVWEGEGRSRLITVGLRGAKWDGRFDADRPTNDLLGWLDEDVRAGVVDLSRAEARRALERERFALPGGGDGFVVLRVDGRVIGRAFARGGTLMHHEIPKARAAWLEDVLDAG